MTLPQIRNVCRALKLHAGSVALTAAALGLPRETVAEIAEKHGQVSP